MESPTKLNQPQTTQDTIPQTTNTIPSLTEHNQSPNMNYWKTATVFLSALVLLLSLSLGYYITREPMPDIIATEPELDTGPVPSPSGTTSTQIVEVSPTQPVMVDPTQNWKKYTNSEVGFSVQYPQQWIQTTSTPPRVVSFVMEPTAPSEFFIAYHQNIDNLPKWLGDNQAGKIIGTVDLNGNQFTVIESELSLKSREYAIQIDANSYLRLVFEPFPNTILTNQLIEQILSTFMLID